MKKLFTKIILLYTALSSAIMITAAGENGIGGDYVPEKYRGLLDVHNVWRAKVDSTPLSWSKALAAHAQDWADTLKKNNGCRMRHRQPNKHGENLAWASGKKLTGSQAAELWAAEIKNYNYHSNSCSGVCGHYTQLVWKNTQQIGCGMAECGNSEVWVCNYDPPGNWVGEKPY